MAVVYVKEQGAYLIKRGEQMLLEKGGNTLLDLPLIHLENIAIFGNVQISTQLIDCLLERGIDVSYFSGRGKYLGHISTEAARNIFLRLAQYELYQDSQKRREMARLIVANKIRNQTSMIQNFRWTVMLGNRKLELQEQKTLLGRVGDGFDFLGYHFSHAGKNIPARAESSLQERLETMWLSSKGNIGEKLKKGSEIVGGWEQYYRQERKPGSILEYAVFLFMVRNKAEENVRTGAVNLRTEFQNIYKDLTEWFAEVWKSWGLPQMELFEFEQYFQVALSAPLKDKLCSREMNELLETYHRLLIQETKEDLEEAVQLYADLGLYQNAAQMRIRLLNRSSLLTAAELPAASLSGERMTEEKEWKPSLEDLRQYMTLFCGREELYGVEKMLQNRRQTETRFEALSEDVVRKHLHGELTVSTYIQRPNGTAHFMVFDVDISRKCLLQHPLGTPQFEQYLKKAEKKAYRLQRRLADRGLKTYLEFSGYRGFHVWLFFSEWIPVRYLNLLQDALQENEADKVDEENNSPSGNILYPEEKDALVQPVGFAQDDIRIECFPNRQRMKPDKPGQCIKLPLGIHTKTARNSYFLNENLQLVPEYEIGAFLRDTASYSLNVLKKVLGSFPHTERGAAAVVGSSDGTMRHKQLNNDLTEFGALSPSIEAVLRNCSLMLYLCQKARETGYLAHGERLSVLYVFGHLGDEGKAFVHTVMEFTINYQYSVTEKFISKLPEKPISCIKLRDQYKTITAEYGCSCRFKRTKNCYPSPVLHAIRTNRDETSDITIPTARTVSKDKEKEVYEELSLPIRVQELSEKIVGLKKQKRGLDRAVEKLEKELEQIFNSAGTDCMEIQIGLLIRRKKEEGKSV